MAIYFKQKLDNSTLDSLADFICGDNQVKYPEYRSSGYLTRFFNNVGINVTHNGSTRKWWVLNLLQQLTLDDVEKTVLRLVDIREYKADREKLEKATNAMNDILFMENMRIEFNGRDPIIVSLKMTAEPIIQVKEKVDDKSEEQFLKKDFDNNDIAKIGIEMAVENILKDRINESQLCLAHKAPLASVFMAGSTLEGLLLGVAAKYPKEFNQSVSSPKDENNKVKAFQYWTLDNLINVSHEAGFLGLDVKKFSHALRDFRNYIHPFEQAASGFTPNEHTAKICLQVLNSAVADLIEAVQNKKV